CCSGLKSQRLGQIQLAFVFQGIRKPWRLPLIAEVRRGGAAELDGTERFSGAARPAAMVPGTHDQIVVMRSIEPLERVVDPNRSVEVFLIPPSSDTQRGHRRLPDRRNHRLTFPE